MKLKYFLIPLLFFLSLELLAQFGEIPCDVCTGDNCLPSCPTYPDCPPCVEVPDPGIPLDGGVSLLLVAGAIYGGKKLLKRKK